MNDVTDQKGNARSANRIFLSIILISILAGSIISLLYVFLTKVLTIIGIDYTDFGKTLHNMWNNTLFKIAFSQLLLALPAYLYMFKNKKNFRKTVRFNKISLSTVFMLLLLTITVTPVMDFLNLFSLQFVDNTIGKTISGVYEYPLIISLIAIAGLPCFFEETIYRGVILGSHHEYGVIKAVLINGLLFGAMHMNFNQFAYAFAMGIVFALVVEITDSVVSTMIMHFLINGKSLVLSYIINKSSLLNSQDVAKQVENSSSNNVSWGIVAAYGVFAFFALIISSVVMYRLAVNNNKEYIFKNLFNRDKKLEGSVREEHNSRGIVSTSLIIGISICFLYMILVM